jgi:hypothetical protein
MIDAWSKTVLDTVPFLIHGETTIAGTRGP